MRKEPNSLSCGQELKKGTRDSLSTSDRWIPGSCLHVSKRWSC